MIMKIFDDPHCSYWTICSGRMSLTIDDNAAEFRLGYGTTIAFGRNWKCTASREIYSKTLDNWSKSIMSWCVSWNDLLRKILSCCQDVDSLISAYEPETNWARGNIPLRKTEEMQVNEKKFQNHAHWLLAWKALCTEKNFFEVTQ